VTKAAVGFDGCRISTRTAFLLPLPFFTGEDVSMVDDDAAADTAAGATLKDVKGDRYA
jgi:hypothetical protein